MARDQVVRLERRRVLQGLGAVSVSLAGGSLLAGCANQVAPFFAGSTGSRPETTTIRLPGGFVTCVSPVFLAADLLRADGFTDVTYVPVTSDADLIPGVSAGDIDMAMQTAAITTTQADTNSSYVHLAGIHVGCYELFATAGIRSMGDLKGKRIAVNALGSASHIYTAAMAAYIGLDPNRDLTWVTDTPGDAMRAFEAGQIDAIMAGPPEPQQLRKMGLGRVIVNMNTDRPWSQYYCCMLIANRAFVQNNPVAAKRALRAVLKATDLCATDPAGAAQRLIDRGDVTNYDDTLQMLRRDVSYDRWREYDPEDTIRFYGLLLHQIGMVKSTPDKIIAQSTDWRILNELKKELKA
jgi:NitT/TauT family transport system substrate-binding protein